MVAAILGFSLVLLLTYHGGVGISPDSIMYTGTARNIVAGKGLLNFDNTPLIIFPAGYPTFLSCIMWFTGKDIIAIAPITNAVLFAVTIYLSGIIIEGFVIIAKVYKWFILLAIAISPSLLDIFSMLWSETLFIVLLLLFILSLKKYLANKTFTNILLVSSITALACITRYIGVSIAATGGIFLLLQKDIAVIKKIKHIVVFCVVGSLLVAINLIRNNNLSGTLTGVRQKGVTPLSENIQHFGEVLCNWLPLPKEHTVLLIIIALIFFVCIAISFIYRWLSYKNFTSFENITACFFTVYVFLIVGSATISRYETLNNRFFAPAFICWLLSSSCFIPSIFKTVVSKWKMYAAYSIIIIAGIAFQLNSYLQTKDLYIEYHDEGIGGYSEDLWQTSATMQFIKNNKQLFQTSVPTYSNACEPVYYFTGLIVHSLPEQMHIKPVTDFYKEKQQYLIWLKDSGNPDLLNINEIRHHKDVSIIKELNDGVIYLCKNK